MGPALAGPPLATVAPRPAAGYAPAMDSTRLGRTGLRVSRLCLGTMTFGLQCDEPTSRAILDAAAAGGITFLDAIDASLRRLGTDYVDLYQLHMWDPETPLDETLRALDDVVRAGKARYVGCSNFQAWHVARALGRSEALGLARLDAVQPRYNLLFRELERELFPLCELEGLGVIPYNPLAGGLLAGKHRAAAAPAGRFTLGNAGQMYQDRYWHEREFATIEALRPLAAEAGLDLVALSVAWVLANPVVNAPIVGASRPEQLGPAIAAASVKLAPELKQRLDALTAEYRRGDAMR